MTICKAIWIIRLLMIVTTFYLIIHSLDLKQNGGTNSNRKDIVEMEIVLGTYHLP